MLFKFRKNILKTDPKEGTTAIVSKFHWWPIMFEEGNPIEGFSFHFLWLERATVQYVYKLDTRALKPLFTWQPISIVCRGR